ncbi:alpha/beta hydrolase [Hydrocarboniphaga sp.]|uniref:alpha/beta fold hydrolase n=1 Tax=Hydrocarboniphaga sp. TaxID=2033016 RepID=UPI00261E0BC8|nr:alpha/beta hydrolase [Hydrocarboniphaga sp.]
MQANGLSFHYLDRGSGPLILMLHGFPDTAFGFTATMKILAEEGYRVVAPFMRGYAPSGFAPDGDYRLRRLGEDALAIAATLGAERFVLVGHDWGALAAYAAAAIAPERLSHLVTAAIPHPGHSTRNTGLKQARRSAYALLFQLRWLPERLIRRRNFAWLENLIRRWSPSWDFRDEDLAFLKQAFTQPQRLQAALAYYRAFIPGTLKRDQRALTDAVIRVPTLQICGGQDGCVGSEMFDGQQAWFAAGLRIHRMSDAGHFMQYERPREFAAAILAQLRA